MFSEYTEIGGYSQVMNYLVKIIVLFDDTISLTNVEEASVMLLVPTRMGDRREIYAITS